MNTVFVAGESVCCYREGATTECVNNTLKKNLPDLNLQTPLFASVFVLVLQMKQLTSYFYNQQETCGHSLFPHILDEPHLLQQHNNTLNGLSSRL